MLPEYTGEMLFETNYLNTNKNGSCSDKTKRKCKTDENTKRTKEFSGH
jgi:hypothetical protein